MKKRSFLFAVYDIIFLAGFILYLPLYLWRKKINFSAFKEKIGFIGREVYKDSIWIQAVSVGEANLIVGLVKRLREAYGCPIIISVTTLTGKSIAEKKYGSLARVIFFPLDVSFILNKVLKKINPRIFIAVETEIWPNLFRCLKNKNIPTAVVHGRISDAAFRRYKLMRRPFKRVLNNCSRIAVQNREYKERFIFLGADESRVVVTGNMKFGNISVDNDNLRKFREKFVPLFKAGGDTLLVAASTHPPEEEIIAGIYKEILTSNRDTRLIIAPRHPERAPAVESVIRAAGFEPVRLSRVFDETFGENTVFIIDSIGELLNFYSIADICFVGGSLSKKGGHNILEPVYFLKPTVFGPNMDNFRDIERAVLEKGAGIEVKDKEELKKVLLELINNRGMRDELSNRCREVFEKEKQALENNFCVIEDILKSKI